MLFSWAHSETALCRTFVKIDLLFASCQSHQIRQVENSTRQFSHFYCHFNGPKILNKNSHFCTLCVDDVFRLSKDDSEQTGMVLRLGWALSAGKHDVPSSDASSVHYKRKLCCCSFTFNRWRTVVSATWKYDDPRLNMSHEGALARTTVCHMFCRLTNYKNLELYRVGQKNGLFSDLITLWRIVLERRTVCQNFRHFIEKKGTKLALQWV